MQRLLWAVCGLVIIPALSAGAIELSAFAPTMRVRPDGALPRPSPPQVFAAKGETESLQIVVTAKGEALHGVDVAFEGFASTTGGATLTGVATFYRVADVPIRRSAPRATKAPGLMPDPLVPFIDPYTGRKVRAAYWDGQKLEDGRRVGAAPFDLWPDRHAVIWMDIAVPRDAAAGVYTGDVTVRADREIEQRLPITVTVWDFALPEGPTHENHLGHLGYGSYYEHADEAAQLRLEERYGAALAAHRINPDVPRKLWPKVPDNGPWTMTEEADAALTAFVERYHVTNVQLPMSPYPDPMGENREKSLAYYRSLYEYVEAKGWADRSYIYMFDEPNDADAYARVRELGDFIHEAEPRLRCLVVEQTYTQDPEWTDIDPAVDIWCPLFGFVDEPSIQARQAGGDDVWSYTALIQTAPPYHPDYEAVQNDLPPFWQIDFPVTGYRIAPWLNRRYNITGLLYWAAAYWGSPDRNPWHEPGFRVRWNGEGSFFYPGDEAGIEGPIASIRLKNLRDGMEDYEYFALLESLGGTEEVDAIVREAVPTWGTWRQEPDVLPALRKRLAEAILSRKK